VDALKFHFDNDPVIAQQIYDVKINFEKVPLVVDIAGHDSVINAGDRDVTKTVKVSQEVQDTVTVSVTTGWKFGVAVSFEFSEKISEAGVEVGSKQTFSFSSEISGSETKQTFHSEKRTMETSDVMICPGHSKLIAYYIKAKSTGDIPFSATSRSTRRSGKVDAPVVLQGTLHAATLYSNDLYVKTTPLESGLSEKKAEMAFVRSVAPTASKVQPSFVPRGRPAGHHTVTHHAKTHS